jgi:hypothetical protein
MITFLLVPVVFSIIDDENPDGGNFCVLDEQGQPVNCNVDDVESADGERGKSHFAVRCNIAQ